MKTNFIQQGQWYKGNTHMHTTRSDGALDPKSAVEDYKNHGYDFVVVTDHVRYTNTTQWNDPDFLVIPGVELHVQKPNDLAENQHVTGLYTGDKECAFEHDQRFEPPYFDGTDMAPVQEIIDVFKNNQHFAIYAHPDWSRTTPDKIDQLEGFDAIEVWNQHCDFKCQNGDGTVYWDILLRQGRKLWAIATDDRHLTDERSMGGYIVVKAKDLTVVGIANAMKKGSYYSSNGPQIKDFYVEGNQVYGKGSPVKKMAFITDYYGHNVIGTKDEETVCEGSHTLNGNEKFVRMELIDHCGKRAWSNPIYLK